MLPSGFYILGGVMGSVAVFFGTGLAIEARRRTVRYLLLGFWMLVALLLMGLMQLGALSSPDAVQEWASYISAALPILSFAAVLIQSNRAHAHRDAGKS